MFCISPLQADIYKWADADGNLHFSDKPHEGAEKVILPPTQTYSPPQLSEPKSNPPQENAPVTQAAYTELMIVQPQDQETIRSNQGLLSVIARVEPGLNKGDTLQLLYDGAPIGSPQTSLSFSLNQIYRGTHTLQFQVLNEQGGVVNSSKSITFYMHHTQKSGGH